MRLVAVAAQQLRQFLAADPRQHGGIGDLESVQMKDRKYRAIACRIQKLVGVPAGRQGAGFGLAVADDAGDDQIRIVESGTISMDQGIAQFPTFMDRARRFRRHVTGNSIRPGELPEQPMQSAPVTLDRGVSLGIRPFQISVRHDTRTAMAGANDVDHVEVIILDQPVQMDIDEIQSRGRAPMAEQAGLDVLKLERLFQQRIILQVDLPDRKIVRGAPIGVHLPQKLG